MYKLKKYQLGGNDLKTLKKKYLGDIYENEKNKEGVDLPGFDYWKEKFMKNHKLNESESINLIGDIKNEQRLKGVSDKIYKYPNSFVKSSQISKPEYVEPYNKYVDMKTLKAKQPEKQTMGEDYFVSGAKSVKQYRGDENLPEAKKGMKNCGCKHPKSKYKYGTGALTIPEGSAIVTANGGKNMQALKAYKKGNYKLLNDIIDDMPEDKVYKADGGNTSVKPGQWSDTYSKLEELLKHEKNKGLRTELFNRYKKANPNATITEDSYIDNLLNAQKQNYALQEKYGQDKLNEENWDWIRGTGPRGTSAWKNKRYRDAMTELGLSPLNEEQIGQFQQGYRDLEDAMQDPQFQQTFGKYFKTNPIGKSDQMYRGKPISGKDAIWGNTTNRQFLQLSGYEDPVTPTIPTTPTPPQQTPPDEEYEDVSTEDIKTPKSAMSAAEYGALRSVLNQPIAKPTKNFLKLERPGFVSNLPAVLRDIDLSEREASKSVANMVGGDSRRFLENKQRLFGSKIKAAAEAGAIEAEREQQNVNEGTKIGNIEKTTNRNLKDYYDDIERQGVNDYNALLVKSGQSFDESFDTYQKMKNENQLKSQQLQLLKEANPNYTQVWDANTGTYKSVYRYKRKPTGTTSNFTWKQSSSPFESLRMPSNNIDSTPLSGKNLDLTTTDPFNPPDMFYRKGIKKAKTYKRK